MGKMFIGIIKILCIYTLLIIVGMYTSFMILMYSLDHKMDAVVYSIESEVSRNNYLPEEAMNCYMQMFSDILDDYAVDGAVVKIEGNRVYLQNLGGKPLENLVSCIEINYDDLKIPKGYGERHSVNIVVYYTPIQIVSTVTTNKRGLTDFATIKSTQKQLYYGSSGGVPCSRYIK